MRKVRLLFPYCIHYPGSVAEAGVFSAEAGIRTFGSEPAPSLQVAIWKQILMHITVQNFKNLGFHFTKIERPINGNGLQATFFLFNFRQYFCSRKHLTSATFLSSTTYV